MNKFLPDMYQKTIFDISYNKLKTNGIKVLLFDLDNTLIEKEKAIPENATIELINKLKDDFTILIVSNTIKKTKVNIFHDKCNIPYVISAKKPFKLGYKRVKEIKDMNPKNVCMIGDQLLTDVWGGKRMGYFTVLVDPIGQDDMSVTKINRVIEAKIINKLNKEGKFEKGKYYE